VAAAISPRLTRENFRPVLLWRGKVPFDARASASVDVPLSDALTLVQARRHRAGDGSQ
jgi:hypothetical protein